jgi:hypothetical protein
VRTVASPRGAGKHLRLQGGWTVESLADREVAIMRALT